MITSNEAPRDQTAESWLPARGKWWSSCPRTTNATGCLIA